LQIDYLPISGIGVLTVVCAICDIRSKSGFGTNTPQIAGARPQTSTIKNYCFYDQTTQNYSTANNPNKHYLHFAPFSRQKS
jgi:hypothetical protein